MKKTESSCPNCGTNIKIFDKETRCPICDCRVFLEEGSGEVFTHNITNTYMTKCDNNFLYITGLLVVLVSVVFFIKVFIVDWSFIKASIPPPPILTIVNMRPTSKYMIDFCESAFDKPMEKITQEEYDSLKEWSIHYSPERKDFKIVYSFDNHNYHVMRIQPKNMDEDRIPLYDFQPFRNLEALNFEDAGDFIKTESSEQGDYGYDLKNLTHLKVLRGSETFPIERIPELVSSSENLTFVSGCISDGTKLYEAAKNMKSVSDLKILFIDSRAIKYVKFISRFKNLKRLDVVALQDNSYLSMLSELKSLTIEQASNDSDYSELCSLINLERLMLKSAMGVRNIDFVSDMSQLEFFSIDNSDIIDISLLRDKPLKSLSLISNNKIDDYTPIVNLEYLERLHVSKKNDDSVVRFPKLDNLKNLRNLTISSFWVKRIEDSPRLENLTVITQLASDFYIDDIAHLSRLKSLFLIGGGYVKHSHKFLEMKELRRLEFQNVRLMFMNLNHVFNHESLYALSFDKIQSYTMDFEKIKENHNLRVLYFEEADTVYDMVKKNEQNVGIRAMDLPESPEDILKYEIPIVGINTVQDDFYNRVDFLTKFKGLKTLVLKNANLKDIRFISKIPNLEYVDLSGNNIEDVSSLHALSSLKTLILYKNPVENLEEFEQKLDVFY